MTGNFLHFSNFAYYYSIAILLNIFLIFLLLAFISLFVTLFNKNLISLLFIIFIYFICDNRIELLLSLSSLLLSHSKFTCFPINFINYIAFDNYGF